jgi:hypothetical protein
MSEELAQEPKDRLRPNSTLTQVLSYVDSPFKLGAIVVMAVLTFGGYLVYENQAFLIQAYDKKKSMPVMDSNKFDETAKMLMKNTGAQMVVIFEVDMILNQRKVLRMFDKDGRIKQFDGVTTPLFSNNDANNKDAIALMAGETPCHAYTKPRSLLSIYYMEKGITYACRVSVPSSPNAFIGQITIGFDQKPSMEVDHYLRIAGDDLLQAK